MLAVGQEQRRLQLAVQLTAEVVQQQVVDRMLRLAWGRSQLGAHSQGGTGWGTLRVDHILRQQDRLFCTILSCNRPARV